MHTFVLEKSKMKSIYHKASIIKKPKNVLRSIERNCDIKKCKMKNVIFHSAYSKLMRKQIANSDAHAFL